VDTIPILLIAAFLIWFVLLRSKPDVDGAAARALVKDGATLLDVRSPAEHAAGHIDGALNIPVGDLEQRLSELSGKDQPIVVYCRSGARSASAKRVLQGAGFTAVHDLGAAGRW
jgi:phage shock protein E